MVLIIVSKSSRFTFIEDGASEGFYSVFERFIVSIGICNVIFVAFDGLDVDFILTAIEPSL